MRLTISFLFLSLAAFAQHGSGPLQAIADKSTQKPVIMASADVPVAHEAQSGPVARAVQPDADEVSCHVQEVKLPAHKASEWQPWLRVGQKDGKVWAQKRRLFPRQIDALQECHSFVELASYMRSVNAEQAKHAEAMNGTQQQTAKDIASLKNQNDELQRRFTELRRQLDESGNAAFTVAQAAIAHGWCTKSEKGFICAEGKPAK